MNQTSLNIKLVETFCSLNIILTLPLNCYIIWVMLKGTKRTLESDIFSLNLALSEIFFCLSELCFFIFHLTEIYGFFYTYIFSLGFLFTGRPLFQSCICIEYYMGVVYPVAFLKYKPLRYRVAVCCVTWLTILASCIYCMLLFTNFLYHYAFFIQDLFFMAIVVFCCLSVLKALKKPGPGENIPNNKQSNTAKRRAFKIIFFILISVVINFIFSVAPVPFQCCLTQYQYLEVMTVCIALSLASGILQPLLYLHRAKNLTCFKKTQF